MQTEANDHWSDCAQIFYHYGKGYSVADTLQSVCLGNEVDIVKASNTGEVNYPLTDIEHRTLMQVIEYRKELARGEPDIKKPSPVRSRPAGAIKHRANNLRQAPQRKRIPVHSVKH